MRLIGCSSTEKSPEVSTLEWSSLVGTGQSNDINNCVPTYPKHFLEELSNMQSPSESMNNMTVGSIGENFENIPITTNYYPIQDGSLPAIYTRKCHLSPENNRVAANKHIGKPDVVFGGGNYTETVHPLMGIIYDSTSHSGIQIFSSDFIKNGLIREAGTSYSAPLAANLAAKIVRKYPYLSMQSIKALIINSSNVCPSFENTDFSSRQERFIFGYGKPSPISAISSDENEVSIIIENNVELGEAISFPIHLPEYLSEQLKDNALLKIDATICFSFMPLKNDQLCYCPINLTFGIFKNIPLNQQEQYYDSLGKIKYRETGISGGSKDSVIIHEDGYWAQDGFGKSKLLSNVQKETINVSRKNIVDENFTFKIAVGCRPHGNLSVERIALLQKSYKFSLVLKIRENLADNKLTNRLYNELCSINKLDALGEIISEADLDADIGF